MNTQSNDLSSRAVFLALVVLLGLIVLVGLGRPVQLPHGITWGLIAVLMAIFAVLAGYGITGRRWGVLIDSRNKMSLSRLQLLSWTIIVLSAYLTAVLFNISAPAPEAANGGAIPAPADIAVPSQLWVVMGISTASAVGASMILSEKEGRPGGAALHTHSKPQEARWGDLLKGDDEGGSQSIDLGKLQMFLFTFVLLFTYAALVAESFQSSKWIHSLPTVADGMNVLLGISHTGYLSKKAISTPTTP